jgi:hypothetical protein
MKNRNIIIILTLLAGTLLWNTGCNKFPFLEGNGNVVSEERTTVSFNRIENQGEFNVYYVHDTVFLIVIEAESNLISHIRTIVHGSTLEIDSRENLNPNHAMKVWVHTPALVGVKLSGSGLINAEAVTAPNFDIVLSGSGIIYGDAVTGNFNATLAGSGQIDFSVESENTSAVLSGSGKIKLVGNSPKAIYVISGSGIIDAVNLLLAECNATISGSGNIYTSVSDYLNVTISGSGNLYYFGYPQIDSKITGSGKVISNNK